MPPQGSEQDGSEFAVERVDAPKHPVFRVQKNALGQVLAGLSQFEGDSRHK